MDIEILSRPHAMAIVLAVGDDPGRTVRRIITTSAGPSNSHRARIDDLVTAGIVRIEEDTFRGRPVGRVHLTDKGETLYRLLCVIRTL